MAYGYRAVHKGRVNKKGQHVKDLEVAPEEAPIVQELFELAAYEGKSAYAMAEMLNNRGLRTHSGAKFTPVHILRILRHEGYLGYIVTRSVKSQHLFDSDHAGLTGAWLTPDCLDVTGEPELHCGGLYPPFCREAPAHFAYV